MNQARIWWVVKPTVGLPLFLGSVALIALLVHFSILTHTTWFSRIGRVAAQGRRRGSGPCGTVAQTQ